VQVLEYVSPLSFSISACCPLGCYIRRADILTPVSDSNYCTWVRDNEPTTLTYGVFTRPKSPNEVLLFERYKDLPALGVHGTAKEFKAML